MGQMLLALVVVGGLAGVGLAAGYLAGRRWWTVAPVVLVYPAVNVVYWIWLLETAPHEDCYECGSATFGWTMLTVPLWILGVLVGVRTRRAPRDQRVAG